MYDFDAGKTTKCMTLLDDGESNSDSSLLPTIAAKVAITKTGQNTGPATQGKTLKKIDFIKKKKLWICQQGRNSELLTRY